MRNAQMVCQKCAVPAPVPWISRASVEQLTGTKLSSSSISAPRLLVWGTWCDICLERLRLLSKKVLLLLLLVLYYELRQLGKGFCSLKKIVNGLAGLSLTWLSCDCSKWFHCHVIAVTLTHSWIVQKTPKMTENCFWLFVCKHSLWGDLFY